MASKRNTIFIAFLIIVFSSLQFMAQTNHRTLFEKAKYTMESKGDLKGAINQFEKIIQEYPAEKEYGAKSQFYVGLCYQKMGFFKAKKAFERVINNYPTQIEVVNLAREKLSNLKIVVENLDTESKDFQLQQVWDKPFDTMGSPSPDGRYISYVNWNVPCLAVYEISTGISKDITSTKGTWEGDMKWAESSIWSPDGKKLAYVWYGEDIGGHQTISIRTVGIDSSEPEEIFAGENGKYSHPCSWSSDGKQLLVVLCRGNDTHEIVMISVTDHSVRNLKILKGGSHPWVSLSPDDKTVAYSYTSDLNSPKTDIFLLNVKDGKETILIDHPETDFNPLWMPDGNNLIFFSDRTGNVSVWAQGIADGRADGKEKLIKNLNRLAPTAITQGGDLFMTFLEGGSDIYNAIIDPETGKVISAPKRVVESNIGWNLAPFFSSDGNQMAYISKRGVLDPSVTWGQESLIIRDLQTEKEHEYIPKLRRLATGPFSASKWSPTSSDEILFCGRSQSDNSGSFIYNIHDDSIIPLKGEDGLIKGDLVWSKDGNKLFYCRRGTIDKDGIYSIDRHSQKTTRILNGKNLFVLSVHPNGKQLAVASYNGINILNLNNGKFEELYKGQLRYPKFSMTWSPDGEWLYFSRWVEDKKHVEIWRISSDGNNVQQTDISFPHLSFISIHPDGKRLAFTVGKGDGNPSIWLMKNFLPK